MKVNGLQRRTEYVAYLIGPVFDLEDGVSAFTETSVNFIRMHDMTTHKMVGTLDELYFVTSLLMTFFENLNYINLQGTTNIRRHNCTSDVAVAAFLICICGRLSLGRGAGYRNRSFYSS